MHRTALEVRENSLLDPSGPRLKASSVTTIRSSAHEEEEEASGEDFDGASPRAATPNAPLSSILTTPHPAPAATPPTACSSSPLRTDESGLTCAASFAESHGSQQTEGGGHSTVDGAKGPIGILGAVDVSGVQTENTDSRGGRNSMDCRMDVSQCGSGGVDYMDVDQSRKGADLGTTTGQRDGQGHTVGVENGRTGAGGVGTDLNQNGSHVRFDQSGGAEGQGADATGGGGVGRTGLDQNGSGVDHDMNFNQSGNGADGGMCTDAEGSGRFPETGAKNSEADGMGIDQSISGAAHVDKDGSEENQGMDVDDGSGRGAVDVEQNGSGLDRGAHVVGHRGEKVKGGGGDGGGRDLDQSPSEDDQDESTSSSPQAKASPEAEASPEAKDSSTRKRKTLPPPEPANKGGKRKAPRKKPVRKPRPKAKPEPKPGSELQSEPQQSPQASTLTYFEEIEIKGPQGSKLRLVEMIDLTSQVWVRPLFPVLPFLCSFAL